MICEQTCTLIQQQFYATCMVNILEILNIYRYMNIAFSYIPVYIYICNFFKKKTNWIKKNHSRLNQHDSTSWQCVQINSACVQLNTTSAQSKEWIQ